MAELAADGFARYYAEKLWELIPPVYRSEDGLGDSPGALRALVEVLADQAAVVRRSTDRLWEDQFVEGADDWAVPYLGDLVGTRLVSALNRRGRRVDVSNTIHYRRRAGTLALLEGLVADITGWEGTVVEEFRRLLRFPHGLDAAPAPTGRFTGTTVHGLPDLRASRGSQLSTGPWDEYHHLPDVRRHRGGLDGRYGISKLAFHLYRLLSLRVVRCTPTLLAPDLNGKHRWTFDPSGRQTPLFQRRSRALEEWGPALEWELPAPISCEVLGDAHFEVTEGLVLRWASLGLTSATQTEQLRSLRTLHFDNEGRFRDRLAVTLVPPLTPAVLQVVLGDALVEDCGKGALLPAPTASTDDPWSVRVEVPVAGVLEAVGREVIRAGDLSAGQLSPSETELVIDAAHGLGYFTAGQPPTGTSVTYHYGFSAEIGAGPYDRPVTSVPACVQISGGGAIAAPPVAAEVTMSVVDSVTYSGVADLSVNRQLTLTAGNQQRPYVELAQDWVLTATAPDSALTLDGLWLGSRLPVNVRLVAAANCAWSSVTLSHLTLDPGGTDADGATLGPVSLSVESTVATLSIDSSVVSSVQVAPGVSVDDLTVANTVVQVPTPAVSTVAISHPLGTLTISGSTVVGELDVHRLVATELLCTGDIRVDDLQSGCIRFSAFPAGSLVPRAYRAQTVTDSASLFTSLRFGDPGYAQLSEVAPEDIRRGGEDGTEIGAFHHVLNPVKLDSLQAKVEEFLPFGLLPIYIKET